MKRIQGKKIIGFTTIYVVGNHPESFFQHCANHKIIVWDIEKLDTNTCVGKLYWYDIKEVKRLNDELPYELTIDKTKGLLPTMLRQISKKEIIFAALLSVLFIFLLSNIVWKLEITGVTKEMDETIRKELDNHGLYAGAWTFGLDHLDVIQQDLLHHIPDLLYIGIHKNGTAYQVDAVEKLIEKKETEASKQDLIASKNGVIEKMYIENGIAEMNVHDFVKKGDLLVSGVVTLDEDSDDPKTKQIGAKGKVFATTWYEVAVSIPLYSETEKLSGDKTHRYGVQLNSLYVPIWGFGKVKYDDYFVDESHINPKFLQWNMPLTIQKETIYDKNTLITNKNAAQAKQIGLEHALDDLSLKLGSDAEILNYNILHESVENGKVNMNLYISVLENIAEGKDIK